VWAAAIVYLRLAFSPRPVPLAACTLWFQSFYFAVAVVRELLADAACGRAGRANSVSGHAMLHVYYCLLVFEAGSAVPVLGRVRGSALDALAVAYVMLSGVVLAETWSMGFHSSRQLVLGVVFGVACWALLHRWYSLVAGSADSRWWQVVLHGVVFVAGLAVAAFLLASGWVSSLPATRSDLLVWIVSLLVAVFPLR
jgi:hypothetical protein